MRLGWSSFIVKIARKMMLRLGSCDGVIAFGVFDSPSSLSRVQQDFVEWNAKNLGISVEDSEERFRRSWRLFRKGYRGGDYRDYCVLSHEVFKVFHDDAPGNVFETYKFHSHLHFLRFLSYPEQDILPEAVFSDLAARRSVRIVDYGCGLAQVSMRLAGRLQELGVNVDLTLADIPTIMKDFLVWRAEKLGLSVDFIDCDTGDPYPAFPPCDVCIATEVFEHVHDPVRAFGQVDRSLNGRGYLVADIGDHRPEFFHVSPNLSALRAAAGAKGYREVAAHVYIKE